MFLCNVNVTVGHPCFGCYKLTLPCFTIGCSCFIQQIKKNYVSVGMRIASLSEKLLALREEHRLRVLKRIFGPKTVEVQGRRRRLHGYLRISE
jgi:hypothetical protein